MQARAVAILVSFVLAVLTAGCGSGGSAVASPASGGGAPPTIRDAWVRAAQAGGTSAAYLSLTNGGAAEEQLVGVRAADLTDTASLHETSSDASGMTGMSPVDSITIPAGGTVALAPGGYHIMLMDLKKELKAGDRVTLALTFKQAGEISISAEVRAN